MATTQAVNLKATSYWERNGKYQQIADALNLMLPTEGKVDSPALEKFRKASNCYYDLYNNGLWNRAKEFRLVFGFAGTPLAKRLNKMGNVYDKQLEQAMNIIILEAAVEQNIIIVQPIQTCSICGQAFAHKYSTAEHPMGSLQYHMGRVHGEEKAVKKIEVSHICTTPEAGCGMMAFTNTCCSKSYCVHKKRQRRNVNATV